MAVMMVLAGVSARRYVDGVWAGDWGGILGWIISEPTSLDCVIN